MLSEPTYNKKLDKPKTLIGNWYEESFQKPVDPRRKRFENDPNFSMGKERATFMKTETGLTGFMVDDHDFKNHSMGNIQSMPDLSYHYETNDRISSVPMISTLRDAQESALKAKPTAIVSKRKRMMDELLLQEAKTQVECEIELKNRNENKLETTYSVENAHMEEVMKKKPQRDSSSKLNQVSYVKDEPISFYTDSISSENGENTTVYHTKTTGVSQFGRNTAFSTPITEYNRNVTQNE